MKSEQIQNVTVTLTLCDVCAKVIQRNHYACCMCRKDLCEKCVQWKFSDSDDYYPIGYCKVCLEIGQYYLLELEKLKLEYETKEQQYYDEWRAKCQTSLK